MITHQLAKMRMGEVDLRPAHREKAAMNGAQLPHDHRWKDGTNGAQGLMGKESWIDE
jgi:hypothetical protein